MGLGGSKPSSISAHKRKITLSKCRKLCERMLEWYREPFEQYVRAYREYYGYDPDTEEVGNEWAEDKVEIVE